MKNSKLLTLLEHLNSKELERLDLYLQSPFFIEEKNKELHKRAYKLFIYIIDGMNDLKVLEKKEVYTHIYPKEIFKAVKINQLMAYLVKKIEQFIVYKLQSNGSYYNDIHQKQLLLSFYIENKINRWYEAQKRDIDRFQTQINLRDNFFYLYQFLIECNHAKLVTLQSHRKEDRSLKNMLHSLDVFYVLSLLEIACLLKTSFTFDSEDFLLLKDKINSILKLCNVSVSSVDVYKYALELLEGAGNDKMYVVYRDSLMQYYNYFTKGEARNLFTHALTYCINQLNKRRDEYYEECWNLYYSGIEKEILYIDGKLMPSDLKNITTISLRLKKYEWAEEFLQQHKHRIQSTNSKEVYSFNLANVYFHQQNYSAVHQILASLKCKDVYYDLAMRRLEIKVFYEQEEIELLYAKINAYRIFVRRNRNIDKDSKLMNNNFLSLVNKLIKIIPRDKKQINSLGKELQTIAKLAERKWIIAKLEELKK